MNDRDLIEAAAREAGALALDLRARGLETWTKADASPVTAADLAVDELLKQRLRAARPDYGWLSEETADDKTRLGRRQVFIIDPIDGTRAFMKGQPWFTVCIAVVTDGLPAAAAVFAPEREEMYSAASGGGASLNGRPITVSDADSLDDLAMLGDARMFAHPSWPVPWPAMQVTARNSVAYRMALVASGAFDAAVALTPKHDWDVAAADLIVREAGGVATDHLGEPFLYNRNSPLQRSLVCAGPAVHGLLLDRLAHIDPG